MDVDDAHRRFDPRRHLASDRKQLMTKVNIRTHRALQILAAENDTTVGTVVDTLVNDHLSTIGVTDEELDRTNMVMSHNQMLSRRSLEILDSLHAAGKWNWTESMETALELLADQYGTALPMPSLLRVSPLTREAIFKLADKNSLSPADALHVLVSAGFEAISNLRS